MSGFPFSLAALKILHTQGTNTENGSKASHKDIASKDRSPHSSSDVKPFNIYDTKTFISNVAADQLSKMPANRRNTAHEIFLQFHRHTAKSMKELAIEEESDEDEEEHHEPKVEAEPNAPFEMFHHVMKTGVIYASSRAAKYGFNMLSEDWANMGQGAPEVSICKIQLLHSVGKSTVDISSHFVSPFSTDRTTTRSART